MSKRGAIIRATGMLGAISALVIGATFALSSTQAELTNAEFSSITENLKVAADCTNFAQSDATLLNISGLAEGADYVPGNAKAFCLKDLDTFNLAVSIQADLSNIASTGSFDATKVRVRIVDTSNSNTTTNTTLQLLESGPVNLNGVNGSSGHLLANGGVDHFTINIKLDNGAVLGNMASISNLGLLFNGTEV